MCGNHLAAPAPPPLYRAHLFLLLPMRTLRGATPGGGRAGAEPAGALSFRDADHGGGKPAPGGALAWLEALLHAEGIDDVDGRNLAAVLPARAGLQLQAGEFLVLPPPDGSLRAIVAEVNNTFGERHAYLLDHPQLRPGAAGAQGLPRLAVLRGRWRLPLEFARRGRRPAIGAGAHRLPRRRGPLLLTGMAGRLEPLTAASRRALWRAPC